MKLTKETLKRIIKEELEESRLRRHLKQKKTQAPEPASNFSPREIQKIIDHPWMDHYVDAHTSALGHDWHNAPIGAGITQDDLDERAFFNIVKAKLAGGSEELTLAVVKKMMEDGTLGEEFLMAIGRN
jgi:hypothetical protein